MQLRFYSASAVLYLLSQYVVMRFAGWESFKRNVQFVEKCLRHLTVKANIAVPSALRKQIRKDKDVLKKT